MFEWWIVLSFQFVIFILVKNNLHKTFAQLACFNNFTFLCFFSCDNCFYKTDMLPLVFFLLLCFSKVLTSSSGQDCLWKLPIGMLLRLWHWWILWYFLAGFKTIILCLVHSNTIYKMCFLLRYGLWKFQLKSCNILNRTLQNMIFEFLSPTFSFHSSFFEFLSPTFSFHSSCYICLSLVLSFDIAISLYIFGIFLFFPLYFLLFCCILNNLMLSVLHFPLLLLLFCLLSPFTVCSTVFQFFCIFLFHFLLLWLVFFYLLLAFFSTDFYFLLFFLYILLFFYVIYWSIFLVPSINFYYLCSLFPSLIQIWFLVSFVTFQDMFQGILFWLTH